MTTVTTWEPVRVPACCQVCGARARWALRTWCQAATGVAVLASVLRCAEHAGRHRGA